MIMWGKIELREWCRIGGKEVSLATGRYYTLWHHSPHLPEWWKKKFFAEERREIDNLFLTPNPKGAIS